MNLKKTNYVFFVLILGLLASCSGSNRTFDGTTGITSFSILGVSGNISGTNISLTLPAGNLLTSLTPTITVSEGASVSPASGVVQNFSSSVTYTVTTPDATTKVYVVTVTIPARVAGEKVTFTGDGVSFKMAYVPGGLTCPTGYADLGTPATVSTSYWIGETEVTYELWYKVKTWAEAPGVGYSFANDGVEGDNGVPGAPPVPADKNEPVTYVNWRDAMIFSNALTEWYNAQNNTNYTCVYYTDASFLHPIKTSTNAAVPTPPLVQGTEDFPYVKADATGFRMLTSSEWEIAARYKDGTTTNWTHGNYASGATDYAWDIALSIANSHMDPTKAVGWYLDNSNGKTHIVGTATSNALGVYDMSGNVFEWNFDWQPNYIDSIRVMRGGSWNGPNAYMMLGLLLPLATPPDAVSFIGFRFSRTDL